MCGIDAEPALIPAKVLTAAFATSLKNTPKST